MSVTTVCYILLARYLQPVQWGQRRGRGVLKNQAKCLMLWDHKNIIYGFPSSSNSSWNRFWDTPVLKGELGCITLPIQPESQKQPQLTLEPPPPPFVLSLVLLLSWRPLTTDVSQHASSASFSFTTVIAPGSWAAWFVLICGYFFVDEDQPDCQLKQFCQL